jgi:kynurenine 3-monooxygenase
MSSASIKILGSGLCGSLLSIILAKRGYAVEIYESRSDPRKLSQAAGRSINLAMSSRGINALKYAGIFDQIKPLLIPMTGRMLHFKNGDKELQPYGQKEDEVIYSVSRFNLNQILIETAEKKYHVDINFEHSVKSYDPENAKIQMHSPKKEFFLEAQKILVADGAGSVIRKSFNDRAPIMPSESILPHSYKELTIPANDDGSFQLEKNALHVWPRGQFMLIALPNPAGDFTLTLFMPTTGKDSFAELSTDAAVIDFFDRHFASAVPLLPNLIHEFKNNPTGILGTVRCRHWHQDDKLLLIGDAAHALVPFHAQGMNFAFDDCVELDKVIGQHEHNWLEIFQNFEANQFDNATAIQEMALDNYIEMRDGVLDPKFALRKELSFELEKRLPNQFIPRYSMVMFHEKIPYAVSYQRGEIQKKLLAELTMNAEKLEEIDLNYAEKVVATKLAPL